MATKDKLYQEILSTMVDFLSARQNPELVIKYSRYFKDGYDAWGNNDEDLKAVVSLLENKYPDLSLQDILGLGLVLFQNGKYEAVNVGIRLLVKHRPEFNKSVLDGLRQWYDSGVNNWAHSDVLCSNVLSLLFKDGIIVYQDLADWRTSSSTWTRRAVPVSLLEIRKQEKPEHLLAFIEPLMLDNVREVHQGLGWFLRELWKIHPQPVETFLFKYRNTSARLIFQYATEKMSKEQKERFRKEKPSK